MALCFALPSQAVARPKEDAGPPPTDELPPQAQQHVVKALQMFDGAAYEGAEQELERAAFYAPNWRPMHYNLGVVAEAQGKLGVAVREYEAFRPYASPEERLLVDQRIDELSERRKKILRTYRRQIALGAGAVTLGAGLVAGGVALMVLGPQKKKDGSENAEKEGTLMYNGGIAALLFGVAAVGYSFLPLIKSVESKRRLDGIALGKTRLHWAGSSSIELRF